MDIQRDYGDVAVLIPCYNEGLTVYATVTAMREALPGVRVYVYDNRSTDDTAAEAARAGAEVRFSPVQGKGATVRQMFKEIDARYYVMTDGDTTYPAEMAPALVRELDMGYDLVLGDRLGQNYYQCDNGRFHNFGNWLVKLLINTLYHGQISDVMSGFRGFSRDFVKTIRLERDGFEVETEMTIWALRHNTAISTVPIHMSERPEGSVSKVRAIRDGMDIVFLIIGSWLKGR